MLDGLREHEVEKVRPSLVVFLKWCMEPVGR